MTLGFFVTASASTPPQTNAFTSLSEAHSTPF